MKHRTYDQIVKLLPKKKSLRIVDFGCGDGRLLEYLPRGLDSYVGYDINASSIELARKKYTKRKSVSFRLGKKGHVNLGKDNSTDVVAAIGVLQYLSSRERKKFISQTQKVLTPGGVLLISCAVDHTIYKIFNIYRLFLPNKFINRSNLIKLIEKHDMKVIFQREKGLILNPLFSNVFIFFFDAIDKLFFRVSGAIGPIGKVVRAIASPLLDLEYLLPVDYGHTLFIKAEI